MKKLNPVWILLALFVLGIVLVLQLPRIIIAVGDGVGRVTTESLNAMGDGAGRIMEAFTKQAVTNVFQTATFGTQAAHELHVATWRGEIRLRRKEESGWTAAEVEVSKTAEVPVYIPLAREQWSFDVVNDTLIVRCPDRQYGPAAVDNTSGRASIRETSWRIREGRMIEEAYDELDRQANGRAAGAAGADLGTARNSVAEFIRQWVLKPHFPNNQNARIIVLFPGEEPPAPPEPTTVIERR